MKPTVAGIYDTTNLCFPFEFFVFHDASIKRPRSRGAAAAAAAAAPLVGVGGGWGWVGGLGCMEAIGFERGGGARQVEE